MKKVLIFIEDYKRFMKNYIIHLSSSLNEQKIDFLIYGSDELKEDFEDKIIVQNDLEYFYENNDPRLYEGFLDYAIDNKIEDIFIARLRKPEFFYSEMLIRKNKKINLIFSIMAFELYSKSAARRNIMFKISRLNQIKKIIIHSILGKHLSFPNAISSNENDTNKYIFLSEPQYEDPKNYHSDDKLNQQKEKFKILYFGNMFYSKGVDILINASKYFADNIEITLAGDIKTLNFDYDKKNLEENNFKFISHRVNDQEMYKLFKETDIVVLPYRRTYLYGTSGVFQQSLFANKPVICSNFYPFDKAIDIFKCGETFISEDPKSLASKVNKMKESNLTSYCNKMSDFIDNIDDWDKISKILKKEFTL